MRTLLLLIALSGCAGEDYDGMPDMGDTLGSGRLSFVGWSGGLCQRDFRCVGTLNLGPTGFVARLETDLVADGQLTQPTLDTLDGFVAAIRLDEPTGVFTPDGGDSGKVEMRVERNGEVRTYFTNGFRGDFGVYISELVQSIDTCSTTYASYETCAP